MVEKEILTDFLSKKNLRMTSQRDMILNVFLKTEKHLTSEDLYNLVKRKDKSIGQATIYRFLKLLTDAELAREVEFGDGVIRYEHNYGHKHHDHIICVKCNESLEVVEPRIEKLQEELAKKYGYTLKGHKMYLYGICESCRKKG